MYFCPFINTNYSVEPAMPIAMTCLSNAILVIFIYLIVKIAMLGQELYQTN